MLPNAIIFISLSHGIRMLVPMALTFSRGMMQQMRFAHLLHHPSPLWRGFAALRWATGEINGPRSMLLGPLYCYGKAHALRLFREINSRQVNDARWIEWVILDVTGRLLSNRAMRQEDA